jgi:hypothetical protein
VEDDRLSNSVTQRTVLCLLWQELKTHSVSTKRDATVQNEKVTIALTALGNDLKTRIQHLEDFTQQSAAAWNNVQATLELRDGMLLELKTMLQQVQVQVQIGGPRDSSANHRMMGIYGDVHLPEGPGPVMPFAAGNLMCRQAPAMAEDRRHDSHLQVGGITENHLDLTAQFLSPANPAPVLFKLSSPDPPVARRPIASVTVVQLPQINAETVENQQLSVQPQRNVVPDSQAEAARGRPHQPEMPVEVETQIPTTQRQNVGAVRRPHAIPQPGILQVPKSINCCQSCVQSHMC